MNVQRFNLGLIGYPLAHSLSPQMHTAALRMLGLDGEYRLYPVPPLPEGDVLLKDLMTELHAGTIDGLNVTIPHKLSVLSHLDELTPTAQATGAVNTIKRQEERLLGDNTDVIGFMTDMKRYLPVDVNQKQALVLGAGGAARAVVYGLVREGWKVVVAARRLDHAEQISADLQVKAAIPPGRIVPILMADLSEEGFHERLRDRKDEFALIVNTTPLGMMPNTAASSWPSGAVWPQNALAYDLVYNPQETTWMRAAQAAGLPAVNGLGMLVEQAAMSFEIWTGLTAPRHAMALAACQPDNHYPRGSKEKGADPE